VPPAGAALETTAPSRAHPSVFGMVLFLASELMFFGGLFAAYFTLRSLAVQWPPPDVRLDLPLTAVATALLATSSLTMHTCMARIRQDERRRARAWLVVTFALGAAFLGIKGYELATADFGIGAHAYGSMFFTMLGAHGLHLVVGLALLILIAAGAARARAEAIGYYWHFVDAVWLSIFGAIYLIR
jgi:cytochrome c oxidase subunit 3